MRMLNSLPPERRCSQKGLALDLSLCSQKQDLACFLSWQGTRSIPTSRAGHVNIAYSILPHPQGCTYGSSRSTQRFFCHFQDRCWGQDQSILQICWTWEGTGLERTRKSQFYQVELIH